MSNTDFKIDLTETFEHLPNAPIVEAVIHWRARPEEKLEPDVLLRQLQEKLPDYANPQRQHEFGVGAEFGPDGSSILQHHNWHGFRFETEDKLHVAQFTRNGFVFSRLKPYEDWEQFEAEALEINNEETKQRLKEMRWIKNKAFVTFLKEEAFALFRG